MRFIGFPTGLHTGFFNVNKVTAAFVFHIGRREIMAKTVVANKVETNGRVAALTI
jgi:hypothetical protein